MPQVPVEHNERLSLRIAAEEKSILMRAAALEHTHLTDFVISKVVSAARQVIEWHERLEEPPAPNEKLTAAAFALPKQR